MWRFSGKNGPKGARSGPSDVDPTRRTSENSVYANFRESPEGELRLLSSSTKFGHPLVTPSSGRPGNRQASEGTHAPADDPNLQTSHRRRSGHLRENGRRRSVRRR